VSGYAGFLHDAAMLYGLTADSMIKDGLDPRDGRAFLKHSQAIFFQGKLLCYYTPYTNLGVKNNM